jgi:hypothetical protein
MKKPNNISEQNVAEPTGVEQNVAEPTGVEQNVAEPIGVEQNVVEQNVAEPIGVEQNVVEQKVVEPNVVEQKEVCSTFVAVSAETGPIREVPVSFMIGGTFILSVILSTVVQSILNNKKGK